MSLYFRGKLYENTLRNRIIANIFTFMYRSHQEFDYYLHKYVYLIVCFLLGLCVFAFCSCSEHSPLRDTISLPHVAPDTCVVDSQNVHGHDYLLFYRPSISYGVNTHLEPFQVIHSPDCFCRYNRKFIVVKHE